MPIMIPQLCSTVLYVSKLASLVYLLILIRKGEKEVDRGMAAAGERCMRDLPGDAARSGHGFMWLTCCERMHKACAESSTPLHGTSTPCAGAPKPTTDLECHRQALKWAERERGRPCTRLQAIMEADVACKSHKRQLGFGTEEPQSRESPL